jgi:hypothetical protein
LGKKEVIDREMERMVLATIHSGGCMFSPDHRIPNDVTIENYRYYIWRLKECIARKGG